MQKYCKYYNIAKYILKFKFQIFDNNKKYFLYNYACYAIILMQSCFVTLLSDNEDTLFFKLRLQFYPNNILSRVIYRRTILILMN